LDADFLPDDFFEAPAFGAYAMQSSSIIILGSANPLSTVIRTGYGF